VDSLQITWGQGLVGNTKANCRLQAEDPGKALTYEKGHFGGEKGEHQKEKEKDHGVFLDSGLARDCLISRSQGKDGGRREEKKRDKKPSGLDQGLVFSGNQYRREGMNSRKSLGLEVKLDKHHTQ